MKILFDVGHPAQVHFYKNAAKILHQHGHEIMFSARDKEVLIDLLKAYKFKYKTISRQQRGFLGLSKELLIRIVNLKKIVDSFKPDIMCGAGETVAIVSKITRTPSIIFTDSEHVIINKFLTVPFADLICTPNSFKKDFGKKHVRYKGFKELSYLHPKYFCPNPAVLKEIGINPEEQFMVLRFISWNASHDAGQSGIRNKSDLIKRIEPYGKILISCEGPLNQEFKKYQINLPPEKLHDLLYYAALYLGESGTMATEAALLGTPSVLINSLAKYCGAHNELMVKYHLQYFFDNEEIFLNNLPKLIDLGNLKNEWEGKRNALLSDTMDITEYTVNLIENWKDFI